MRSGRIWLAVLGLSLGLLAGCGRTEAPAPTAQPEEEPPYYEEAADHLAAGEYDEAAAGFSRAIEAGQERARAYIGRGDSYYAMAQDRDEAAERSPDLLALALRDYESALELDPSQGEHIYDVYTSLAEQALEEGAIDSALSYLHTAVRAAPDGKQAQSKEQAEELIGGILTGAAWYQEAPDSRYYVFFPDGTGQIIDPVSMDVSALTYERDGFGMHIAGEAAKTEADWTYEPELESWYTDVPAASAADGKLYLRLQETAYARAYGRLQASILGAEANGRLDWTTPEAAAAGYQVLYEKAGGLMEALAVTAAGQMTEEDAAALEAARAQAAAIQAGEAAPADGYAPAMAVAGTLLARLPADSGSVPDTSLGELFPVGEDVLTDYCYKAVDWAMKAQGLALPEGVADPVGWEHPEDIDHWFSDGRLYLCLPGAALRQATETAPAALAADGNGRFAVETPLRLEDDVTLTGDELAQALQSDRWIGLWDMGYSTEVFRLELAFDEETCGCWGGYFPGELSGGQSGPYALEGDTLTLTLSADGYVPGTYQYQVVSMGGSLYMTLLTEGIVYGQTAGSTYMFCGAGYAAGVTDALA